MDNINTKQFFKLDKDPTEIKSLKSCKKNKTLFINMGISNTLYYWTKTRQFSWNCQGT